MAKQSDKPVGISFAQLQANLSKGNMQPVYLIYGVNEFMIGEAADAIADALAAKNGEVNRTSVDGNEVKLPELLDNARTQDLFSPFKVLIVSPADKLLEKQAVIASYAQAPSKNTCLILLSEKADKRWRLTKLLEPSGGIVLVGRIYENEIPAWIIRRAKSAGYSIDSEAAQLLTDFLGEDLATIASEIQKLAAYAPDRKNITAADVEAVSLRDRMQDIFGLTDAIGRRQTEKTLPALDTLIDRGERPTGILYMVGRHMRQLWSIKELVGKGMKQHEAALSVTHNNYIARKCAEQLENFSLNDLRRCITLLLEAEAAIKSSQQDDQTLLEMAFIRLTQPHRQSAAR